MSQFIMISRIILYNSLLFVGLNVEEAIIGKEKDNIDLINVILHSFQIFFFSISPQFFFDVCVYMIFVIAIANAVKRIETRLKRVKSNIDKKDHTIS